LALGELLLKKKKPEGIFYCQSIILRNLCFPGTNGWSAVVFRRIDCDFVPKSILRNFLKQKT